MARFDVSFYSVYIMHVQFIFGSMKAAERPPFGKKLLLLLTLCSPSYMNHDTLLFRFNLILDSQAGFCSGCVSCYFVFTSSETLKPCRFAAKVYNNYNVIFGDFRLSEGRKKILAAS